MEKYNLEAIEMIQIASQHAYCADYLLKQNAQIPIGEHLENDTLLPVTSLMYTAFKLTFKAYLLHEKRPVKQYKSMLELMELNSHLGLSKLEKELIHTLVRTQTFQKGLDYQLWDNRQQLQVFCEQIMDLYERLQSLMPLELQPDFVK